MLYQQEDRTMERTLTESLFASKELMALKVNQSSIIMENQNLLEDTGIEKISDFLNGCKVTIVSGGGIAAIEVPRLLRELRRHGAMTQVCMTENCFKFVGIDSMRWASQNEVIVNATGLSEHICTSDIIVVVPTTADLLSKIRYGICSDAATTLVQSALGAKKIVVFCQTMHDSLKNSPIIQENKKYLEALENVFFIQPRQEEGKQKIPDVESLSMNISHIFNKASKKLNDNILVTLGGTRVMLDPVRCITNLSTGATGIEVAKLFYANGYKVTALVANISVNMPLYDGLQTHILPNYEDMYAFVSKIDPSKFSALIHLVAASDFEPQKTSITKINSKNDELNLKLVKTKKLIQNTNLKHIKFKAAAKLTSDIDDGLFKAEKLLTENNLNAVFWSCAKDAWGDNSESSHKGIFIENIKGNISSTQINHKKEIANAYFKSFEKANLC
jgi:phosphopantothenoylcysteine decarboxylase/phosphopantothenate--cysteine ligase